MTPPRSPPRICAAAPSSIFVSPPPRKSNIIASRPSDYVTMFQAMRRLGVSRQTVWQRVKRGELEALHVTRGRQKGLRIKVMQPQSGLFDQLS